jgi:alkanesulfonate monooxygenase SsuD/methylene tetrahydromethanopterin reductase-like flavin-dependent oxidoreductase (luciferase family)
MKFSLFSIVDYYGGYSPGLATVYMELLDQIVEAERLGFDAYWIGEHHGYRSPQLTLACPNPAIVLADAAARTQHIGLYTAVANLAVRHPLLLAEDYALVDVLSNGRLGLGIGRGTYPNEYAAFGQSREDSRDRFAESWEIIQQAWSGESVTFKGRFYQIDGFKLSVLPVQKPLPRYWYSVVRAESFASLARAAQPVITLPHLCSDGLATLSNLALDYRERYLEAGGEASRYELPLIFYTCVAGDRREAEREGQDSLLRYLVHQHPEVGKDHLEHHLKQLQAQGQLWFGAPDDLISWIKQYQSGVDSRHFVFWLNFGGMPNGSVQHSMRYLAQDVMPEFTAPGVAQTSSAPDNG